MFELLLVNIVIRGSQPPNNVVCLKSNYTFDWNVDAAPGYSTEWIHDGVTIMSMNSSGYINLTDTYNASKLAHVGNGSLTLLDVQLSDAGTYTCRVSTTNILHYNFPSSVAVSSTLTVNDYGMFVFTLICL